jgi:hybrid cluster-associated redox disulfide protein
MQTVISRSDLISDVTKKYPKAIEMLTEYGLHCANCFLNTFDTIEAGATLHGMTDEEINKMVEEINAELIKDAE